MYYIVMISLYFMLMLALGFFHNKKASTFSEYILGNRSMSAFVIGVGYLASEISVGTFTVAVSMIYKSGLSRIWIDIGFLIFTILCWQVVAKRLRSYSEKLGNSLTIPQYLANRFQSTLIGIISSFVITLFIAIYIAANLLGFAKVASGVFDLPKFASYSISFFITIIYVAVGGFRATCFTDVVHGLIMLAASLILPIALTSQLGIASISRALKMKSEVDANVNFTHIMLYMGFGLCIFGMPHTITKFMAIKSCADLRSARNISITLNIVMYCGLAISALYAITVLHNVKDSELILFQLSMLFLHPFFGSIIIIAMIAAVMSTVDSQLVLCSSCLTNDVYKFISKKHSDQHLIKVTRLFTIAVSIVALLISVYFDQSVLKLGLIALTGLGSSIGPIIVASLYSKKINALSAILGIVSGMLSTFILLAISGARDLHYNLLPAFCISCLVIFISSFLSRKFYILSHKLGINNQVFKGI